MQLQQFFQYIHSMMSPLNISPDIKKRQNFEFRPIKKVIPGHVSFVAQYIDTRIFNK